MTTHGDHKQRLKDKALIHNDAKKNKKDNAKKSTGTFNFSGSQDDTKDKKHKGHRIKNILTSRLSISIATALTVSLIFIGFDKAGDISQQDNLDPSAAGEKTHSIIENKKTFPNPPSPEEDTLGPSNVGEGVKDVDKKSSLAIGDSTIAWANGQRIDNTLSGCSNEKGTWADNLKIKTLACPGYTTRDIAHLIRKHPSDIEKAHTIFLTAGSNDIRGDKVGDLDYGVEEIIESLDDINPKTNIILIGYLPIYVDKACMNIKDRNSARRLYDYHRKANYALQDAALRHNLSYIDNFHSPFNVCDKNHSYIRLPRHNTPGANWHTTEEGHEKIEQSINNFVLWKKD